MRVPSHRPVVGAKGWHAWHGLRGVSQGRGASEKPETSPVRTHNWETWHFLLTDSAGAERRAEPEQRCYV